MQNSEHLSEPQSKTASFSTLSFYFIPLALQALSQSITYPLVAAVAARGDGGAINIAGLAQANIVSFFIASMGAGIFIAGMIFGKTSEGYHAHRRICFYMGIVLCALQIIVCIPPIAHLILGVIMGLPADMEKSAYIALLTGIPLQFIFAQRTPYMTTLFVHKATGRAYTATLGRIILTIILAYIFCMIAFIGPFWAIVCLTIPVILESVVLYIMARPFVKALPVAGKRPTYQTILTYAASFSIGQLFISLSGYVIASFASRAPNPEITLPVYYAVISLFNAVSFAATRISATVITFYEDGLNRRILKKFALVSGLVLGFVPLIFIIPFFCKWYYLDVQHLPESTVPLIIQTSLMLILMPLTIGMRTYCEGKAAYLKKPVAILSGQAIYIAMIAITSFIALNLGAGGTQIGPIALSISNVIAALVILFSVNLERREEIEIPPTPPSSIPER
ncbi:MAG TPA: hypothetical protein DCZ94_01900 [Lentisphaeria bacterium]|nr:MAG: hypothetical protein A2X48_22620 [Lentisphaerae bacterium GWF2_49_21]HBC85686.1 hypothetical protein [Lentisphaeria bacterium]